jgi:O-antigen ligase
MRNENKITLISDSKYSLSLVWVIVAVSPIVFIEPGLTDILSILALGLFIAFGMRVPPYFGAACLFLGLYLVANIAAGLMAPEPMATIRSISVRIFMALSFLLFTCLIYENPTKVLTKVWNAYIVAVLISISAGIIGYYQLIGPNEQLIENGRVRALFKDPNVYGPFIVPVALFLLARLETISGIKALAYSLLLAFCLFGLLLGFSRGSWINFAAALILYFFLRIRTQKSKLKRRRVITIGASLIIGGIILIGLVASTEKVQTMMDKRLKIVQYYDTGEGGRLTRQLEVMRSITVTPLGIGPGQSEQEYFFKKAPHNLYLHVLIESGWIGGFSFYAFILFTLWRGTRFIRLAHDLDGIHIAAYCCLVGVLIQSAFIDSTHWRHLFLLFAMVWGPLLAWQTKGHAVTSGPQLAASSHKRPIQPLRRSAQGRTATGRNKAL